MASTLFNSRQQKGRGSRRSKSAPMSEINVTPLVDVMLVLLVIFMLTAPLLTVGVPVELPKTKAATLTDPGEPITLTLKSNGKLFLQETEVEKETLIEKVKAVANARPETQIYLRADQGLAYGEVMSVMGSLTENGFHKIALLAEAPSSSSKTQKSKAKSKSGK